MSDLCVAGFAWVYSLDFGRNEFGFNKHSNKRWTREPCSCLQVYTVYFCGSCKYVDLQDLASKKCYTFEFTQITQPYFRYCWIEIYKQPTNQREDHSNIVDCWMICLK